VWIGELTEWAGVLSVAWVRCAEAESARVVEWSECAEHAEWADCAEC
jgi:hypothetical protein